MFGGMIAQGAMGARISAVVVGYLEGNTFAKKLERAIARSDRAKLIEAKAIEVQDR